MTQANSSASPQANKAQGQDVQTTIKGWYLWLLQLIQRISGTLPDNVRQALIETLEKDQAQANEQANSKKEAVNRLKMVLIKDRSNLSEQDMEGLRGDLLTTIAKYVEVDQETLELQLEQQMNKIALVANIQMVRGAESAEPKAAVAEETAEPSAVEAKAAEALVTDMSDDLDDLVEMELAKEAQSATDSESQTA